MWHLTKERQTLICVLFISLIFRIPRDSHIIGDDTFIIVSLARMISEGYLENWTLSAFSTIGLYPFASYSIGEPFIVAIMFEIGLSIEMIALIISIVATIIGTTGAYYLSSVLFDEEESKFVFSFFYSIGGFFFYQMTYFTIHPRGLFMAVLPWFLLVCWKVLKRRRISDIMATMTLFVVLLFIHELAVILFGIYLGIYIAYKFGQYTIDKLMDLFGKTKVTSLLFHRYDNNKKGKHVFLWVIFFSFLVGSFFIGLTLLAPTINPRLSIWAFPDSIIEIAKYFGIRLGVMIFLLPVGIIVAFHKDISSARKLLHIIMLSLLLFIISTQVYALIIFFPVFGYYSVIGYEAIKKAFPTGWVALGLLMMVFTFGLAFTYPGYDLVLELSPFLITFFGLLTIAWLYRNHAIPHMPNKSTKRFGLFVLVSSMILFSLMFSDSIASSTMAFSDDEKSIIEYMQEQPNHGLSFVFSHRVGRRLEAYGFPAVMSYNDDVSLYYGWIDRNKVISGTQLDFISIFSEGKLFRFGGQSPEWAIWSKLVNLSLTDIDQYYFAKELGLEYVIVEKNSIGYSDVFVTKDGMIYHCNILRTAPLSCELVLDGQMMSLFRLR